MVFLWGWSGYSSNYLVILKLMVGWMVAIRYDTWYEINT